MPQPEIDDMNTEKSITFLVPYIRRVLNTTMKLSFVLIPDNIIPVNHGSFPTTIYGTVIGRMRSLSV